MAPGLLVDLDLEHAADVVLDVEHVAGADLDLLVAGVAVDGDQGRGLVGELGVAEEAGAGVAVAAQRIAAAVVGDVVGADEEQPVALLVLGGVGAGDVIEEGGVAVGVLVEQLSEGGEGGGVLLDVVADLLLQGGGGDAGRDVAQGEGDVALALGEAAVVEADLGDLEGEFPKVGGGRVGTAGEGVVAGGVGGPVRGAPAG